MGRLFNFSNSSSAVLFGISPLCGTRGERQWWRVHMVRPIWNLGNRFHNAKWWLFHRLHPAHRYNIIDTGLKPGYYDVDTLMLNGCFALLRRYVEKELGGVDELDRFSGQLIERPDPNAPEGLVEGQVRRQNEASELYNWWMRERPRDLKRYSELLHDLYGRDGSIRMRWRDHNSGLKQMTVEERDGAHAAKEEMRRLEDKIDADEQEMLHRLIDIRRSLWT